MSKYSIAFRRNDRLGTEEYSAGNSLEEARREAVVFVANLPEHVAVRICTHDCLGLHTVEYAPRKADVVVTYKGNDKFANGVYAGTIIG